MESITKKIIAIASSTGGTEALEKILREVPVNSAPILIVQHLPKGFTKLFADRLNDICSVSVKEAEDGDIIENGLVYIAPADLHMKIEKYAGRYKLKCYKGVKIHGVMPAADILFESVAQILGSKAVGVVLTGMGADGARGLKMMHNKGAKTICQDEKTSVVYGMPKVAKELGGVDSQLPVNEICSKMLYYSNN